MREFFLDAYFALRPKIPQSIRMAFRRALATRSLRKCRGSWPINELACRPPAGWTGWRDGKKFAFVLTHDVEGKKGLDRCQSLAEIEMLQGFRSSFNFVPEGEYETPRSLREFLTSHGFEVGLHDFRHDGKLYHGRRAFKSNAERMNRYLAEWGAVGFRSGFMLHNFDWLSDLNILYDLSSFDTDPFEPQPDGVNTIFPFWVGRGDGSGYVELPYTLPQDSTLFLLLRESGIDTWKQKLDWVARHGGLALVNVHPDYMGLDGTKHSLEYAADLYRTFLSYVADRYQHEAWFALPKDVAAYVHATRLESAHPSTISPSPAPNIGVPLGQSGRRISDETSPISGPAAKNSGESRYWSLQGKRVAMVTFSAYPGDPRPRRAAEALASHGVRVDLICIQDKTRDSRREVANGIDILRIPIRRRRGSSFAYAIQTLAFLVTSAIILSIRAVTRGYDLVYVHNMPDILVMSALVPKLLGAKLILDLHDPMPELMVTILGVKRDALIVRLLTRLEAWSIAFVDSVLTVNNTCAKLFVSRGCPSPKMNVVMNSPDEHVFRPSPPSVPDMDTGAQPRPFVIMYHGTLVERNGLDLAVQAMTYVREIVPGAELRIYGGSSSFLDRVMDSVREKNLQSAVRYLGPKSLEQIAEAIGECDVGVVPNQRSIFTELNTPTRIFEYLALGKPVIAPWAPGIQDYFDDRSLIFFDLGNAHDLAEKIVYVHSHTREAAEIVRRGQDVFQEHSWRMERVRLLGVIAKLLPLQVTE